MRKIRKYGDSEGPYKAHSLLYINIKVRTKQLKFEKTKFNERRKVIQADCANTI